MTLRNSITTLLISTLTCSLYSCNSQKPKFIILNLDSTIRPTKISITDLAKNYKKYQGRYIETTGRFYRAFETFVVLSDEDSLTGKVQAFWLGTKKDLNIDDKSFGKMNGKRIKIKGAIDTMHKGHLSMYLATIDEIYFWEQQ